MEKLILEIKEILKMSPARFAKVYYRALIEPVGSNSLLVKLTSTFDYSGTSFDPVRPTGVNNEIRFMEKWHATGMAVGSVEYYLQENNYTYNLTTSESTTEEIVAEFLINV